MNARPRIPGYRTAVVLSALEVDDLQRRASSKELRGKLMKLGLGYGLQHFPARLGEEHVEPFLPKMRDAKKDEQRQRTHIWELIARAK